MIGETMKNEPSKEQIERLPVWAQRHIERLKRQISDAQETIRGLQQDEPSNAYWTTGLGDTKKYIPDYGTIHLNHYGERNAITVHWDSNRNAIAVMAYHGGLLVQPWATNLIHVEVRPR